MILMKSLHEKNDMQKYVIIWCLGIQLQHNIIACYWYVKIPLCGWVEHVLEWITFMWKKYMIPGPSLVRNKPPGAPPFVRLAYWTWYAGAWVHDENMTTQNVSAICKLSFLFIFRDGGDFRGNPVLHNNCAVKFGMAEYGWGLSPETKKKARLELNEIPETRQMALEAVRQQMITRPDISEYKKCEKLLIHSQTSMVQQLKFGNG